jgi:hypothetical protein
MLKSIKNKLKNIPGGLEAAKSMAGGLNFCEDCLKRKINESSPEPDAFERALSSGKFNKTESGSCFLCGATAEYKVGLKDAMKAIKSGNKQY